MGKYHSAKYKAIETSASFITQGNTAAAISLSLGGGRMEFIFMHSSFGEAVDHPQKINYLG